MAYRGTLSATVAGAGSSAKNFIFGEQSTFNTTEDVLRAEYGAIWSDTHRRVSKQPIAQPCKRRSRLRSVFQAAAFAALRFRSASYRISPIAGC